uniref:Uncharacterized protein n=1 Tax=Caenorhabditis tropicalis TaxID=1561998 RepID=A0A1I7UNT6_9PELO
MSARVKRKLSNPISVRLSNKVEQYRCQHDWDNLIQVKRTGLAYNPSSVMASNVLVFIEEAGVTLTFERGQNGFLLKSQKSKKGKVRYLSPQEVMTEIVQKVREKGGEEQEEKDPEAEEKKSDYEKYIDSLLPFDFTVYRNTQVVIAFNYISESYETFCYDEMHGEFIECTLPEGKKFVKTSDLIPKYIERAEDGKMIIHVFNDFTRKMEKYWYNTATKYFEQVAYPELIFNPSKESDACNLLIYTGKQYVMAIMRDPEGFLKTEKYCQNTEQYIVMPPEPVKTFIVLKKEEQKKKEKEEEERRERPVPKMPSGYIEPFSSGWVDPDREMQRTTLNKSDRVYHSSIPGRFPKKISEVDSRSKKTIDRYPLELRDECNTDWITRSLLEQADRMNPKDAFLKPNQFYKTTVSEKVPEVDPSKEKHVDRTPNKFKEWEKMERSLFGGDKKITF